MFDTRLTTISAVMGCLGCAVVAIFLSETVAQTAVLTVLVSVASYVVAKPRERPSTLSRQQMLLLIGFPVGLCLFLALFILGFPLLQPSLIAILAGTFAGVRGQLLRDRMSMP